MKKTWIVLIVIGVVVLFLYFGIKGMYNSMVIQNESANAQWSQVESQYQRRYDLIPNLVATVKGYATHEQGTLTAVIEARAKATSITIDPSKATAQQMQQFQQAQGEISSTLSKLMVVVEQYPDLKANKNFLELQAQIEGTENRIATERQRFNEAVQAYNAYIKKFPNNIFAGMFGFSAREYFKSEVGAEKAPKVQF